MIDSETIEKMILEETIEREDELNPLEEVLNNQVN